MDRENKNSPLPNRNSDDAFGLSDSLCYVRWLMRPLGIWPLVVPNPSNFERSVSKIVIPIAIGFMLLVIIPMLAEVAAQRGDRSEMIALLAPITYQSVGTMKHFCVLYRVDLIKHCIRHMEADWRRIESSNDREIMVKNIRLAHTVAFFCTTLLYTGSTFYNLILPLYADSTINEFNETIRPLGYPGADLLFDVQAKYVYEIVFYSYYLSALAAVTVGMTVFNLALIFVRHTCGQIQIVVSRLERLVDSEAESSVDVVDNPVASIIKNHARLIKFTKDIEKVLGEVCLLEVITATLLICFLEYYCLIVNIDDSRVFGKFPPRDNYAINYYAVLYRQFLPVLRILCLPAEWSNNGDLMIIFTYGMLSVTISFNLFLYCQIGEMLKEECETVGKAAYMIEWYNLPSKTSLHLIMIMSMSAEPRRITAAGMMEISRVSFANIMKTSFAYLNMMRTVV